MQRILFFLGLMAFAVAACQSSSSTPSYKLAIDHSWTGVALQSKRINLNHAVNELLDKVEDAKDIRIQRYYANHSELWFQLHSGNCHGILVAKDPHSPPFGLHIFSPILYYTGPVLVLPKSDREKGLNQRSQQLIGVLRRSKGAKILASMPHLYAKYYEDLSEALEDVARQRIHGLIMERIPAQAFCEGVYKGRLEIHEDYLSEEGIRLCVLKGDSDLVKQFNLVFNEAIGFFKEKGVLQKLFTKWGVEYEKETL